MASNTIKVSVLGDVKDINRKLGNVDKQLSGFGKKVSGVGKMIAGAFAGVAIGALFKDIVSGASDAQQSLGATETVFGKFADTVIKTSSKAAEKYGLSANEYRENANLIGSLLKNQGVSLDQLGGKTETMISKAADLAATFGGDTKSAVEALSSAFKGEFDPLERYGISLKQSTVSAEAMRLANVKNVSGWNKLTDAQKKAYTQQATTNLINKQSKDSAGAFAKETNTLAHQQQVLAAKVQNVKDKIGGALLPVLTQIASYVSDKVLPKLEEFGAWFSANIMPKIQEFGDYIKTTVVPALMDFGTWIQNNRSWLEPLAVAIGAIIAAIQIWTAVTKAYTAVQAALNIVMSLNPIGIVVLAIIGLIAAIVYLWKTNEGFRNTVLKVWAAIKSGVGAVVNWFKTAIPAAWNAVKSKTQSVWNSIKAFFSAVWNGIKIVISTYLNTYKAIITGAWNAIKSATTAAWNAVKSAIDKVWSGIKRGVSTAINAVVSKVREIKGKVTGVFASAGSWLLNAGRNILQGLLSGIQDMIGKVKNKLQEVTNLIPDWKGPADKDKNLLRNAGRLIMGGLINGIDDKTSALKRQLRDVTNIISGTDVGSLTGGNLSMSMAGSGSLGLTRIEVTVNVPPTADKAAIGREIKSALDEWTRVNGR